jgi:RNA polymerase sigma-B factor
MEHDRDTDHEELVRRFLPLVERCARRFRGRGEPLEDLVQVGTIGLLKALERFDPARGVGFPAYAAPTITGEIRRHLRDRVPPVRVPRRVAEVRAQVSSADAVLTQALGREPTSHEIADALDLRVAEVEQARAARRAQAVVSLDAPVPGRDGAPAADALGGPDEALLTVEDRVCARHLLDALGPRERRILGLRYLLGMTQAEIAEETGISQVHVSRVLERTLTGLRERGAGGDS